VSEFESTSILNVVVDQQSLRSARQEVEQSLGSISVNVENGRARARSDGGAALAGAGAVEELGDQTDILEDILDELETGNSGLIGGGGGGGGGGLPTVIPPGFGLGGSSPFGRGGGGLLSLALTGLATNDFGTSEGDEPIMDGPGAVGFGKLLNDVFGLPDTKSDNPPINTIFPDATRDVRTRSTLAPGAQPLSSLLSGDTTLEDLRKRSKELRESAAGERGLENKLSLDVSDRELIQQLVNRGKIEADSTLARLAKNDNREFSLNPNDRELFERVLADSRQSNPSGQSDNTGQTETETTTPTSSVEVGKIADQLPPSVRQAASTGIAGAASPFGLPAAGGNQSSRREQPRVDVRNDVTVRPEIRPDSFREIQELVNNPTRWVEKNLDLPGGR